MLLIRYAVVVALVVGTIVMPRESRADVDLFFPCPTKRPMMISVENKLEGWISINSGDFSWDDDFVSDIEQILIDEHSELEEKVEVATRHYVLHKAKFNGDVADSAVNGVKARFEWRGDDWNLKLQNDRSLTGGVFDTLFGQTGSLGLWIKFPDKKYLGDKIDVNLGLITSMLLGTTSNVESAGNLRIDQYEPIMKEATLIGKATFSGTQEIADTQVQTTSEGTITLKLSVLQKRIVSIEYDGKLEFSGGSGGAEISGSATHKCSIKTDIDPKVIAKKAKKKPKFRTKKIRAPRLGVGIKLPSHWTRYPAEAGERSFVRTLDFKKGVASIDLKMLDGDSSYQPGAFFDSIHASLKGKYPGLVTKKTKNPLGTGQGRVYYVPTSGSGDLLQLEVYPWRGKFLMLRLYGPANAYRAAYKEFMKAKSTLGRLKPKRTR